MVRYEKKGAAKYNTLWTILVSINIVLHHR